MGCQASKEAVQGLQEDQDFSEPLTANPKRDSTVAVAAPYCCLISNPALDTIGNSLGKFRNRVLREGTHHLRNIFAIPFDVADLGTYRPPVHAKSAEEREFIEHALRGNWVFDGLSHAEIAPLVQAFEKYAVMKDEIIITQGDEGDYFYVIVSGACSFTVDGKVVGEAKDGDSFGELALLYTCPRAATVTAVVDATLFRVDQRSFKFILQTQTTEKESRKLSLLKGVSFLDSLSDDDRGKLAAIMTPRPFTKDEVLGRKGDAAQFFYILDAGQTKATDIEIGGKTYEDVTFGPGEYFGHHAIMIGEKQVGNVVALSDGRAFVVDRETFTKTLGEFEQLITRSVERKGLGLIKVIKKSNFDGAALRSLGNMMKNQFFKKGETVFKQGEMVDAALYGIRKGSVRITTDQQDETLTKFAFFGEEMLMADAETGKNGPKDPTTTKAPYSAVALEDCIFGMLTLADCRKVVDTTYMGIGSGLVLDSIMQRRITLQELTKHTILGAGTFGQVFLVSRKSSNGTVKAYALKIQAKYELCCSGQAKAIVNEKNVMSRLRHPLIANLVASFQDKTCVYMLLELVQGGELYSILRTDTRDYLPEGEAVFYLGGIADALIYMHRRGFVYRDLKPENVLINNEGYPVLVDFGFAKFVEDKTYTLCGTPIYLAPEIILNRGHNWSADWFSFGVLTYEALAGFTPFYTKGIDQKELLKRVVKCTYDIPAEFSTYATHLIRTFLVRDPAQRLGSLAGGEHDIYEHPFFGDIDFDELHQMTIKAPHVPLVKDPLDASNFEDWSHLEDKSTQSFPDLTPDQEEIFELF